MLTGLPWAGGGPDFCGVAVLRHNCNNFSDEAVTFLLGTGKNTSCLEGH